jgi:hypothetical protein
VEKSFLSVIECTWADIRTAEPLVPAPTASEVEMAIEKLKTQITRYLSNSRRTD